MARSALHLRCPAAAILVVAVGAALLPRAAHAGPLEEAVEGLTSPSEDKIIESVRALAALGDPRALPALDALCDDRLRLGADGHAYVWSSKTRELQRPIDGAVVSPEPRPVKEVEVSNEIRRVAQPVLAQLQLASPTASVRLGAAEELSKSGVTRPSIASAMRPCGTPLALPSPASIWPAATRPRASPRSI
jgi:hypothetical protein